MNTIRGGRLRWRSGRYSDGRVKNSGAGVPRNEAGDPKVHHAIAGMALQQAIKSKLLQDEHDTFNEY